MILKISSEFNSKVSNSLSKGVNEAVKEIPSEIMDGMVFLHAYPFGDQVVFNLRMNFQEVDYKVYDTSFNISEPFAAQDVKKAFLKKVFDALTSKKLEAEEAFVFYALKTRKMWIASEMAARRTKAENS